MLSLKLWSRSCCRNLANTEQTQQFRTARCTRCIHTFHSIQSVTTAIQHFGIIGQTVCGWAGGSFVSWNGAGCWFSPSRIFNAVTESVQSLFKDILVFYSLAFVVVLLLSLAFILLHCTVFTVLYYMLPVSA